MGAAVPVAEPQWSGAHQGLALFLGRLLAPLGDRPLAAPIDPRRPDGMLACTLHPEALQVVQKALYQFGLARELQPSQRQQTAHSPNAALHLCSVASHWQASVSPDLGRCKLQLHKIRHLKSSTCSCWRSN